MTADPNADRRGFLGATDVVAVCGLSPYSSPLDVWLEKTGQVGPKPDNPTLRRGRLLEPVVAQLYEETEGCELMPVPRLHMRAHPFLAASPDRLRPSAPCLVEIKTHRVYIRDQYGDAWSDHVPDHILGQVIWQMHICRNADEPLDLADWAHVAAWFDADEFAIFRVQYDEDTAARMYELAMRFWHDNVLSETPPATIGHPSELDAIRRIYPRSSEITIRADEECEAAIEALRHHRKAQAQAEAAVARFTALIKQRMGEAAVLESSQGPFTWRTTKPSVRRTTNYDRLREMSPDVYAQVVTETETAGTRRFCVPRTWNQEDA